MLIDTLLPSWDVRAVHGTDVAASPERTWAALGQVTMRELGLARLLMRLRGIGRRPSGLDRPFLDVTGFLVPLGEARHERVSGMIGRPWQPRPARVPIAGAEDLIAFDRPGWVRIAADFRVVAGARGSRLETETRIQATSESARRRFAVYWRIVGVGSGLVRRDVLRAARRRAELPGDA